MGIHTLISMIKICAFTWFPHPAESDSVVWLRRLSPAHPSQCSLENHQFQTNSPLPAFFLEVTCSSFLFISVGLSKAPQMTFHSSLFVSSFFFIFLLKKYYNSDSSSTGICHFFLLIQIISLIITMPSKITRDFVITHYHSQKELFHYFFPLYLLFVSIQQFFFAGSKRHFSPYLYILPPFLSFSNTLCFFLSQFFVFFSSNKNNLDAKSCYLLKMTITE